jgi:hypothetical protein
MAPLIRSTPIGGQTLVKHLVKPYVNPNVLELSPELSPQVLRYRVLELEPQWYFPRLCVRALLRSIRGNQAPLDPIPEVLPFEAASKCQRPASSQRGWHSDARRCGRPVLVVQAH